MCACPNSDAEDDRAKTSKHRLLPSDGSKLELGQLQCQRLPHQIPTCLGGNPSHWGYCRCVQFEVVSATKGFLKKQTVLPIIFESIGAVLYTQ